jgi:hypothetical protein
VSWPPAKLQGRISGNEGVAGNAKSSTSILIFKLFFAVPTFGQQEPPRFNGLLAAPFSENWRPQARASLIRDDSPRMRAIVGVFL